jgi:hypothetical protein
MKQWLIKKCPERKLELSRFIEFHKESRGCNLIGLGCPRPQEDNVSFNE